jgi:hypothetical protein
MLRNLKTSLKLLTNFSKRNYIEVLKTKTDKTTQDYQVGVKFIINRTTIKM